MKTNSQNLVEIIISKIEKMFENKETQLDNIELVENKDKQTFVGFHRIDGIKNIEIRFNKDCVLIRKDTEPAWTKIPYFEFDLDMLNRLKKLEIMVLRFVTSTETPAKEQKEEVEEYCSELLKELLPTI